MSVVISDKINNTSYLSIQTCDETITTPSNTASVEIIELEINKTSTCPWTIKGGTITYCTTITNPSASTDIYNAVFNDTLVDRLTYVDGSFTVDGVPVAPQVTGQLIEYTLNIASEQTVVICFKALVG